MPTGIGSGIAGDVFQNFLGDGSGGGGVPVCPSNFSFEQDGFSQYSLIANANKYVLGATSSTFSLWVKTPDRTGSSLGQGVYSNETVEFNSRSMMIFFDSDGVLQSNLSDNSDPGFVFKSFPELITNGSFSDVPVGTEEVDNPTFSDAASITPWNTTGAPNATLSWNARFMRMTYTVASGPALFDNLGQTLNTMYSVKMRVRGVTAAGLDQGSAFDSIGDNTALTSANIISNPTLTSEYQDYEFRVWSTNISFRFYLASAAVGDVVDFDSISVKPLDMLVDNGNFSSLGADWTVIDNTAGDTVTFGGSSATWTKTDPEAVYLQQDYPVTLGASHKLTYTVLSNTYTGGGTELGLSSLSAYGQSPIPSSVGTHTVYLIVTLDTPAAALRFYSNDTGGSLEITDISVEELGEGWTGNTNGGFSINASGLSLDSSEIDTSGGGTVYSALTQYGDIIEIGKSYKLVIDNLDITSGNIELKFGLDHTTTPVRPVLTSADNGTYTDYFTAQTVNDGFTINSAAGTVATLSSISVEEVLSENEWHHLALSIDRDSEWKWYVDGVLTNTIDNGTDYIPPATGLDGLAGATTFNILSSPFEGNMTEPSLWNVALSASEVKDIYDNMYGGQRCLGSLPFTSDLITNGNFTQIGPELITNGNFSATGSELVVDGDFSSATDWNVNSNWNINTVLGVAEADGTSNADINQSVWLPVIGKSYKVTFEVVSLTQGRVLFKMGGVNGEGHTTIGIKTEYIVATSTDRLRIDSEDSFIGSVTDVSVKELGEDWGIGMSDGSAQTATKYAEILASGCRIVSDDTATPYIGVQQDALEMGKNYKGSVSVTNSDTGKLRANFGSVNSNSFIDGSNTFYACNNSNISLIFLRNANDVDTTFTNVSAKEVGQNWTVVGSDTTHYVEFPGVGARFVADTLSPVLELQQLGIITPGKSYTVTCNVAYAVGSGKIKVYVGGDESSSLDEGFNTVTLTATGSDYFSIKRNDINVDCVITNITLTQVGGGNLERWWRMNGSQGPTAAPPAPADYITANQAPNGIVNAITPISSPLLDQDTP